MNRKNGLHIPMVNPYRAHFYEINKELSTNTLRENGISVPEVYGTFHKESVWKLSLKYPCIIKPNCGGRTTCTYIIQDRHELEEIPYPMHLRIIRRCFILI